MPVAEPRSSTPDRRIAKLHVLSKRPGQLQNHALWKRDLRRRHRPNPFYPKMRAARGLSHRSPVEFANPLNWFATMSLEQLPVAEAIHRRWSGRSQATLFLLFASRRSASSTQPLVRRLSYPESARAAGRHLDLQRPAAERKQFEQLVPRRMMNWRQPFQTACLADRNFRPSHRARERRLESEQRCPFVPMRPQRTAEVQMVRAAAESGWHP